MGNAIFNGAYSYLSLAQSLSVRFQLQLSSFLQDLCRCTLGRFYGYAGPGPQIWKLCFVPNTSHQERKKGMLHPAPRCHMELHNSMGFKCNFRNIDVIQVGLSNFDTTMDRVKSCFMNLYCIVKYSQEILTHQFFGKCVCPASPPIVLSWEALEPFGGNDDEGEKGDCEALLWTPKVPAEAEVLEPKVPEAGSREPNVPTGQLPKGVLLLLLLVNPSVFRRAWFFLNFEI